MNNNIPSILAIYRKRGIGIPCVYILEGEEKLIKKAKEISRFYFHKLPIFAKFAKIKSRENFSH